MVRTKSHPCPYDSSDIPASEAGCPCDPDPHQHYLRRDMFHQSKLKAVTLGVSLGIEYIAAPIGIMMMAIQWTIDALYAIFDWPGYQARYMKGED